jgi:site-specific DNA recombinase
VKSRSLNAEGVTAPGGGVWYDSTIRGRLKRGDGVLRNEVYIGRLVWRRRTHAKGPVSGRLHRRDARPDELVVQDAPELRTIDQELWERVQDRLASEAAPARVHGEPGPAAFWNSRRPRHLLSGKVSCGVCGRSFAAVGGDYLGCRATVHGSCSNPSHVRRCTIEGWVLEALGRQLMAPELVAEFITTFNAEWKRLSKEAR